MGTHLRHEPTKRSKRRIERLRGLAKRQYRLLADDLRMFSDVSQHRVQVLAIIAKADADDWVAKVGEAS